LQTEQASTAVEGSTAPPLREFVTGLVLLAVAVYCWIDSASFPYAARTYVRIIVGALGICSLVYIGMVGVALLSRSLTRSRATMPATAQGEDAPGGAAAVLADPPLADPAVDSDPADAPRKPNLKRLAITAGGAIVYAIAIGSVGWLVASLVFVELGIGLSTRFSIKRAVVVAVIVIAVWILSYRYLSLALPLGPLEMKLPWGIVL
jgi:hypothetical protein